MSYREKALDLLRTLPRVSMSNIRDNPNSKQRSKFGRGDHGGFTHGCGPKDRQNYMRLGYETGNTPFYLRFSYEPYYKGHHLRRQYPPISMKELQLSLDIDRIDRKQPIDLSTFCNTGLYRITPDAHEFGVQLTEEGANEFTAKINIEVQHAPELVIAAIERQGGVIRTAYYDLHSLHAMKNPGKWFEKGIPIMRRMLPPQDAIDAYTDPKKRGYLADPEAISHERMVLAQKYGYELPKIEDDPDREMLLETKDPRQIFYGLQPGCVISLRDKAIIKRVD